MSKAAKVNFLSQPALSIAIKNLEKELNGKLFERSSNGLQLTNFGQKCEYISSQVLELVDQMKLTESEGTPLSGKLKLGAIYSIGLFSLDHLLYSFMKQFPDIEPAMLFLSNEECIKQVCNDDIDFALVIKQKLPAGLEKKSCGKEPLVAIFSPFSSVQTSGFSDQIQVDELSDLPFISFSEHLPTAKLIKSELKKRDISPRVAHSFNNVELIKQAVRANLGYGVVPLSTVSQDASEKKLICRHFDESFNRETFVIRKKKKEWDPHQNIAWEFISAKLFFPLSH